MVATRQPVSKSSDWMVSGGMSSRRPSVLEGAERVALVGLEVVVVPADRGEVVERRAAGGGPVGGVVDLQAGAAGATSDGAPVGAQPFEGGALEGDRSAAQVDHRADVGAVDDDRGFEGIAGHPLPHDRHGDRTDPGDLASLAVGRVAPLEGGGVDPHDHLHVPSGPAVVPPAGALVRRIVETGGRQVDDVGVLGDGSEQGVDRVGLVGLASPFGSGGRGRSATW